MKIGFSFGRCVRDIVQGKVNIDDVLCIIARTYMPSTNDVKKVIHAYSYEPSYLMGLDQDACEAVGLELFLSGKIIEPRANGIAVLKVPRDYVWMDLYPTVADVHNAGVSAAWESYRMMIELAEQVPENVDQQEVFRHSHKMNLDDDGQETYKAEK
jgi:hypothetical protein